MVTKNVDKRSLSEATVACDVPATEGRRDVPGRAASGARDSVKCVTALDRCACIYLVFREVIVSRSVSGVVVGRACGTCSDGS